MWRASILTIFPEMFPGPLGVSLAGKALASSIWSLDLHDIRDAAADKHRTVDDTPAGGGPGMVMKADVLARALDTVPHDHRPRLLMSPRGAPLTQKRVAQLASGLGVVIVCGRFEGVDERLIAARKLEEVSLGDFILSGGEPAAIALLDACVRMLPGVMGKEASIAEESFADGLLEYPQYTRPPVFEGEPPATTPRLRPGGGRRPNGSLRRAGRTSGPPIRPEKGLKTGRKAEGDKPRALS
jgi:tRNA (guanine37-N1)-methyltransferase